MRRVMSLWLPSWPIDRRRCDRLSPDKGRRGGREDVRFCRPFILAASVGNRRLVTAVNAAAEALGIAPGLPLTDARALHPALAVAAADPAGDAAALARLAAWCGRYSPWTAPHGADGVWLDVTGCAHLRGGEKGLVAEMVERLARRGIACRAAIADTAGAAWAVARCGDATVIVPPGGARAALAALPVMALRLDPVLAIELERLGLRRIGDLYALPRAALASRFGDVVAHRLDQALGAAPEPLSPLPPAPARWTRRRFAEPLATPEGLAAATRELLEALCRRLAGERLGARRLVLTLYRVDGTRAEMAIGTARPSRDPRHLLRLLAERLGAIDPGLGIEDMVLTATAVERLAMAQLRIHLSPRGVEQLLDRVCHPLQGPQRKEPHPEPVEGRKLLLQPRGANLRHGKVSSSSWPGLARPSTSCFDAGKDVDGRHEAGHDGRKASIADALATSFVQPDSRTKSGNVVAFPDKTIARQMARAILSAEGKDRDGTDPAELAALVDRLANRLGAGALCRLVPQESHMPERAACLAPVFASLPDTAWDATKPRPVRLLPRPEPIEAMAPIPDDPPVQFRWRRLQHLVRRADGPERILGEWWRGAEAAAELRDYYRVEDDDGGRFWLFRDGSTNSAKWFLHGFCA
ncbi:MAG TPA: DNA polymerase Y family protein [Stellaceae bacterium]